VRPPERTERQDDSAAYAPDSASRSAHLCVAHGAARRDVFHLDGGGAVVGRDGESDPAEVALADLRMSRRHARIVRGATGWCLHDLGSRNGGFVDGAPFASEAAVPLGDGAVIRLGDSILVLRHGDPQDPDGAQLEAFPGRSPAAAAVRRRLRLLASARGHILILGETGTGKERAARFIGTFAAPGEFVAQNCAELSAELGRSELFGHARGAFSGAAGARDGLVDAAQGGVLFLDEIGELHLDVQADLLRFLEDGNYRPVGSTELRTSRARVVAATNLPLEDAVRSGRFRRDLMARLRATNEPLELPPLRERREDILGWARFFLDEALPPGGPAEPWSAGVAECLLLFPWPENLRELRGAIRSLVERPRWPAPTSSLPERIVAHRRGLRVAWTHPRHIAMRPRDGDPDRDEITSALAETGGQMLSASQLLGIDRRKLYRLCEKLSIDVGRFRGDG